MGPLLEAIFRELMPMSEGSRASSASILDRLDIRGATGIGWSQEFEFTGSPAAVTVVAGA